MTDPREWAVGIDGGGTKTKLLAVDPAGKVVLELIGGPSNLCSNSRKTVRANLCQLLDQLHRQTGGVRVGGLCLGSAGLVAKEAESFFREMVAPYAEKVLVYNDAYITVFANIGEGNRLVVTAGTGSICYGKALSGEIFRAGGWGHLMGDEGSGYDIGWTALHHIARYHDEGRPFPPYFRAFCRELGVDSFEDLVAFVHERYDQKEQIASLARLVSDSAEQGDDAAVGVLDICMERLAELCTLVVHRLQLGDSFSVRMNGSILLRSAAGPRFCTAMKRRYPACTLLPIDREAALGAACLARQEMART